MLRRNCMFDIKWGHVYSHWWGHLLWSTLSSWAHPVLHAASTHPQASWQRRAGALSPAESTWTPSNVSAAPNAGTRVNYNHVWYSIYSHVCRMLYIYIVSGEQWGGNLFSRACRIDWSKHNCKYLLCCNHVLSNTLRGVSHTSVILPTTTSPTSPLYL